MRKEWVGKRQAERTRVQLRAQMRFGPGRTSVDCTIMDISLTGARIVVPDDEAYPSDFDIFIPARSETKWARVRWREKRQLGVEFLKARVDDHDGIEASLLERVIRLEERLNAAVPREPGNATSGGAEPACDWSGAGLAAAQPEPARLAEIEGRLEALEAGFGVREEGAGDQAGVLEPLLDRMAQFEARCTGLGEDLLKAAAQSEASQRRLESLRASFDALSEKESGAFLGGALATASDERVRVLEASVAELKSCLRTLILLTAAQIKQAQV